MQKFGKSYCKMFYFSDFTRSLFLTDSIFKHLMLGVDVFCISVEALGTLYSLLKETCFFLFKGFLNYHVRFFIIYLML